MGVLLIAGGCKKTALPAPATLAVTSADLQAGAEIPKQFTCDGAGLSPALAWSAPPMGTRSIAIIVSDPDAPMGTFIHWVIYDLSADARGTPEGVAAREALPDGSRQGINSADEVGYYGPCPPGGSRHRYIFTVYAVDQTLSLPAQADAQQVQRAMSGHVLATGELMARYGR